MSASDQRVLQRAKLTAAPALLPRCRHRRRRTVATLSPPLSPPLPLFSSSSLLLSSLPLPSLLPLLLLVDC
jgi:hypothetical protein